MPGFGIFPGELRLFRVLRYIVSRLEVVAPAGYGLNRFYFAEKQALFPEFHICFPEFSYDFPGNIFILKKMLSQ